MIYLGIVFIVFSCSFSMELPRVFPVDTTVAELIDTSRCTNYLHLVPREVLANNLLLYLPDNSTAGVLVSLLSDKNDTNQNLLKRMEHIDSDDAARFARLPRLNGFILAVEKKNELMDMARQAVDVDDGAALDYFVFKSRNDIQKQMRLMPTKSLAAERRVSTRLKELANLRSPRCSQFLSMYSRREGIGLNMAVSFGILCITCVYALFAWPNSHWFNNCQKENLDSLQKSSYDYDYPCNITQYRADLISPLDCLNEKTMSLCDRLESDQVFAAFLPLLITAFVIAGVQGVLLVLKKLHKPISQDTQELVILYDQLITHAQEGMLIDAQEV